MSESAAAPRFASRRDTQQQPYDVLVKLLLLGDSAVGKSSLLLRFCEDKFRSAHVLTIGVDFKTKIVDADGEKVKLQIWDTAGQERFRNITPVYFRSAMGVVLVYDITKMDSFENIKYWIKNLDEYSSSDVVKVLVGNKLDLEAQRAVPRERGEKLAKDFKMPFFETSAKANTGIGEAFTEMALRVRRFQKDIAHAAEEAEASLEKVKLEASSGSGSSKNYQNCCGMWSTTGAGGSTSSSASSSSSSATTTPHEQRAATGVSQQSAPASTAAAPTASATTSSSSSARPSSKSTGDTSSGRPSTGSTSASSSGGGTPPARGKSSGHGMASRTASGGGHKAPISADGESSNRPARSGTRGAGQHSNS